MGFSLSHNTTTTSDASRSSLLLLQGFLVALSLLIAPTSLPLATLITGVATTGGYRVSPLSLSKFVFSFIIIYFQFKLFWWLELYDFVWVWKMGVLGMAKCAVIEYLFGVSLCVCCGFWFGFLGFKRMVILGFKWTVVGWVFTLYNLGLMSKWVLIWVCVLLCKYMSFCAWVIEWVKFFIALLLYCCCCRGLWVLCYCC